MKCISVILLLAASSVTCQREERLFHTKQFWDGFERGISDAGSEVQKRINTNLETTMDQLSTFGKSLGKLSRNIEDQVQESLPHWLREEQSLPNSRLSISPEDDPIEVVEGTLGMDGLDDGLEVYFNGDADREELPEPHIIHSDTNSFSFAPPSGEDAEDDGVVYPPKTGGPLFDLRFNFQNRFPMFPIYPAFHMTPFFTRGASVQPWWKGENVCIEEEETDESEGATETLAPEEGKEEFKVIRNLIYGQMEIKSCSETRDKYTCTTRTSHRGINRKVSQIYKCCYGYVREDTGCTKVDMVPLDESLEGLELTEFLALAKSVGVIDLLNTNNLTVFAPSNEAVQDFTSDLIETNDLDIIGNEVYRKKRQADSESSPQVKEIVFSHLFDGFMFSGDMEDEQIMQSMASDSTIRINIYSHNPPIMTANCARITKINQHSTNGVIHTLDRVMQPASKSIADIISSDPQFTILKKLVSTSGMLTTLRESGQMTLLAPTDAAFSTLPEDELQRLIDASACLPSVLKNHILPNVICSTAITNFEAKTLNLLDKYLKVQLHDTGKLFVEDAQIVARDIMATNGVIHIIDMPILPTEAKTVVDVLQQKNLTRFLELMDLAEMNSELEALTESTVFAPSNDAFERMDDDYLNELKKDQDRLKDTLRYHITNSPFSFKDVENNHEMETVSGSSLRLNLYRGPHLFSIRSLLSPASSRIRVTAGCGMMSMNEVSRACGAVVHVIDSFLEPPKHSVLGKLDSEEDYSIFRKIVAESDLAEELAGPGPFTILAPSDHVFRTLPDAELESLLEDSEIKEQLVQRHVLREHMCCSGISPSMFPFHNQARNAHGSTVHFHQTPGGLLKAGSARITHCSQPSTNGIVHTVNSLYVEPHVPQMNPNRRRWGSSQPVVFRLPFMGSN